jgi:hypothetical protein
MQLPRQRGTRHEETIAGAPIHSATGGVPERSKGAVLKTARRC